MACPNGMEAKDGLSKLQFLAAADINCSIYGESSVICGWVRIVTLGLPIALVNIDDYCASPIDRPSELLIFDFLDGNWKKKLLDLAFSEKTNEWCQCKPSPPPPPPFQGGQCRIPYWLDYTFTRYSPNEGITVATETRRSGWFYGPVLAVYKVVENNIHILRVRSHGFGGQTNIPADYNVYNSGGGATFTLDSFSLSKGMESDNDNCGNPPPPPPEIVPPDPPPPPPIVPPELPPPPPPPPQVCPPGPPGPKGDKGDTGDTGLKGDKGDDGEQGLPGEKGDIGDTGAAGVAGQSGPTGDKGDKGDKGDVGATGEQGLTGQTGSQGERGNVGPTGASGATGERGERGEAGESIIGPQGEKGEDAEVEFEFVDVERLVCDENNVPTPYTVSLPVIKSDSGSTANLYVELFNALANTGLELCKIREELDNLDLNVGIPLRGYEGDTGECAVLYFNDSRTSNNRIGRYIQVPYPNMQAILDWADTDPTWFTGNWYSYVQFNSSQGAKVACYSLDFDTSVLQLDTLLSFVREEAGSVYFRGEPRQTTTKQELELNLKRVTYFANSTEKAGQQIGEVRFTNIRMR